MRDDNVVNRRAAGIVKQTLCDATNQPDLSATLRKYSILEHTRARLRVSENSLSPAKSSTLFRLSGKFNPKRERHFPIREFRKVRMLAFADTARHVFSIVLKPKMPREDEVEAAANNIRRMRKAHRDRGQQTISQSNRNHQSIERKRGKEKETRLPDAFAGASHSSCCFSAAPEHLQRWQKNTDTLPRDSRPPSVLNYAGDLSTGREVSRSRQGRSVATERSRGRKVRSAK